MFSFEWALTHRSFPRILRDSSNYSGAIPKFFSKFDVRMNYRQSNVFLQDLSNSFIVGSSFLLSILPECLNNFGGISCHHSRILKAEEEFLLNLAPFSTRFMVLASCHPLIIVFNCENSFPTHPEHFMSCFHFLIIQRPSFQKISLF